MMFEPLAIEISRVERDRFRAELQQQAREPRLEQRGPLSRIGRPARIRTRCDVEDPLSPNALERSERALETDDETIEDRGELGLAQDLAAKVVTIVQLPDRPIANCALHYRWLMAHSRLKPPAHDELLRIFAQPKTIAVVGASDAAGKPGHDIPRYLQSQGYHIVPVNPRGGEILGERAFPSLREADVPIDVVDVFRPPEEAVAVARDAIAIGAKVLWFQQGTDSDEAVALATEAGLTVITRRCMGVTHGLLGLGPGPHARA
jgi:predicted CoA-binding protein